MCGIAGIIASHSFDPDLLLSMTHLMEHRGPDGYGFIFYTLNGQTSGEAILNQDRRPSMRKPVVGLGNRRLAVLDLSSLGAQPMQAREGALAITFNGEIYNHAEIRKELESNGHAFRSRTDTEVILHAYMEWGAECLSRLNGMFAFAIWDGTRQELFAARDRFGEKPFYYYLDGARETFVFGSETKALLASQLLQIRVDKNAVFAFLANSEVDCGSETFFENVVALAPAHALSYSPSLRNLKVWRYWDLDPEAKTTLPNDEAYAERFIELLTDSVGLRLLADVEVGSSLSGGLDSSSIMAVMRKIRSGSPPKGFSARFDEPAWDEGPYIREVAAMEGIESYTVFPDPKNLPREIELLTWHQDEPYLSTSIYAQWTVMKLAQEHQVTVLLDGQGADEILIGYHFYIGSLLTHFLRKGEFGSAVRTLVRYCREQGTANLPVILAVLLPSMPRRYLHDLVRPTAIHPDFKRQWGSAPLPASKRYRDAVHRTLYQSLTQTILPAELRHADRNSMAFGREVRLPFLDHRLVEYLFSMPLDQKWRQGTTKWVLRQAVRGLVPEAVRLRKDKMGFMPPQASWLRGPLCQWSEDLLYSHSFRQREWIDLCKVKRVWRGFLAGRSGWHSLIWRWIAIEVWARIFLDHGWARPASSIPGALRTLQHDS